MKSVGFDEPYWFHIMTWSLVFC